MASTIKVDTISEKTSANGVTIDSLSIKDGGLVAAGNIDVNGNNLVLDANANTYLDAGTDDTIKIYVAGAHDATISANAINVLSGTTLTIDSGATITNSGTANGFGALAGIDDQTSSNDDQLTITDSAVIINEDSDDLDFRVESNGNANMLFVDGGNDRVQIGSATSVAGGDSTGTLQITGANDNPIMSLNAFKADDGGPAFVFFKSRNTTPGSSTIVADNDELGSFKFAADDGGDYVTIGANIKAKVDGTPGANDLPTELVFGTTADGANGTTDNMKIRATGNVELTQNLVMASGKGVDFSATSDASGMGNELLDDYEEGTFTISFETGSGNAQANTSYNTGEYTKIGRMVTASGYVLLATCSNPSGIVKLHTLPYSTAAGTENSTMGAGSVSFYNMTGALSEHVSLFWNNSQTHARLVDRFNSTNDNLANHFQSGCEVRFCLSYVS